MKSHRSCRKNLPNPFVAAGLGVGLGILFTGDAIAAGAIDDPDEVAWASRRDLSSSRYAALFRDYSRKGYRLIDVDAEGGYSMVWRKSDGRPWRAYRNMSSADYHRKWTELKRRGYRPLDLDHHRGKWSGIWIKNTERLRWSSNRGLTSAQFSKQFKQKRGRYIPIDVEMYGTRRGLRFAVIWLENKARLPWKIRRNMSASQFGRAWQGYKRRGYRLHDFESHLYRGKQLYAGIWVKNTNRRGWFSNRDMSKRAFANKWRRYRDLGYRLTDFEKYRTRRGYRYAGIWRQSGNIASWPHRRAVDRIVSGYRRANNLPGISVAIIENNREVYRRGFGYADVGRRRAAHGETVYMAASVSKVIGATLTLKMRDRYPRRFSLNARTRSYVPGLPAHHTHRIRDLLTHTACVRHYDNAVGKKSSIPKRQYRRQQDAARTFWNDKLICTPPRSRPKYSTHSFTFLGAALENRMRRSLASMLEREIARPLGLDTLRVQYPMVSDYDRAETYKLQDRDKKPSARTNKNEEVNVSNSSWKIFGGGMEISALDLARFGNGVRRNRVVKRTTKDDMWTPKKGGYGWGWVANSSFASHGGRWAGARSYLRVYKNKALVIAIMSNRRDHTERGGIGGLADAIANAL